MKRVGIVPVCWLLLVGFSGAQVVTLYPGSSKKTRKCSRNVEITVIAEGKLLNLAKVDFCQIPQKQSCLSVATGDDGKSAFSELRPGNYSLHVTTRNGVIASEFRFHTSHSRKTSQFAVDMAADIQYARQLMDYGDRLPIRDHLQQLQGFARDPGGGAIAGADIRVVRREDKQGEGAILLQSDKEEYFSAHLEDGSYIGFFADVRLRHRDCSI